jgi:hypothetical protein
MNHYIVGHYEAPKKGEVAKLPVMIRAEYYCPSVLSAEENCVNAAKADVVTITGKDEDGEELDINDKTVPSKMQYGKHYVRWVNELDDYDKETDGEVKLFTHRTLALLVGKTKKGYLWGEWVREPRPIRYYFLSIAKMPGQEREEYSEDDETLREDTEEDDDTIDITKTELSEVMESSHTETTTDSSEESDESSSSASYSYSSSESSELSVPPPPPPPKKRYCAVPGCTRGTIHFHQKPAGRRPRPRPRR